LDAIIRSRFVFNKADFYVHAPIQGTAAPPKISSLSKLHSRLIANFNEYKNQCDTMMTSPSPSSSSSSSVNEIPPPKVRSVKKPRTKYELILDSGASIHIINNPNFLSCITSCIGQWIDTIGSRFLCKKMGRLCDALKPLPLPTSEYFYQPNDIGNIISLSLLSDSHRITLDTDVENAFFVHNRDDGSFMKYKRCAKSNLYTCVIEEGKEHEVLLHSTVEGESQQPSLEGIGRDNDNNDHGPTTNHQISFTTNDDDDFYS